MAGFDAARAARDEILAEVGCVPTLKYSMPLKRVYGPYTMLGVVVGYGM